MAQWGIAMTWWHPIWTPPTAQERALGKAALDKRQGYRRPPRPGARLHRRAHRPTTRTRCRPAPGAVGQSCHGSTGGRRPRVARARLREGDGEASTPRTRRTSRRPRSTRSRSWPARLRATASLKNPTRAMTEILELFHAQQPDSSRRPPLPDPRLRLPAGRRQVLRRPPQAYSAIAPWVPSRAAHAVAHLHATGHVGRRHRLEPLRTRTRLHQYAARYSPGAASFEELHAARLPHLCVPADRAGRARAGSRPEDQGRGGRRTRRTTSPSLRCGRGARAVPRWSSGNGPRRMALAEPIALRGSSRTRSAPRIVRSRARWRRAHRPHRTTPQQALVRLEQPRVASDATPRQKYLRAAGADAAQLVEGWIAHAENPARRCRPAAARRRGHGRGAGQAPGEPRIPPARACEVLADYLMERGRYPAARAEVRGLPEAEPAAAQQPLRRGPRGRGSPAIARRRARTSRALASMARPRRDAP